MCAPPLTWTKNNNSYLFFPASQPKLSPPTRLKDYIKHLANFIYFLYLWGLGSPLLLIGFPMANHLLRVLCGFIIFFAVM